MPTGATLNEDSELERALALSLEESKAPPLSVGEGRPGLVGGCPVAISSQPMYFEAPVSTPDIQSSAHATPADNDEALVAAILASLEMPGSQSIPHHSTNAYILMYRRRKAAPAEELKQDMTPSVRRCTVDSHAGHLSTELLVEIDNVSRRRCAALSSPNLCNILGTIGSIATAPVRPELQKVRSVVVSSSAYAVH